MVGAVVTEAPHDFLTLLNARRLCQPGGCEPPTGAEAPRVLPLTGDASRASFYNRPNVTRTGKAAVVDWLVELLFKYPPYLFQQGDVRFAVSSAGAVAAGAALLTAALGLVTYRAVRGLAGVRDRTVLLALRLATLGVLAFALARPVLVVRAAVEGQNFIGVLLDDSRSMRVTDLDGQPRSAFVATEFTAGEGSTLERLGERFEVRLFSFAASLTRRRWASELAFDGPRTRIGEALARARDELSGLPVAALVLVTDGVDTSATGLTETLAPLKAEGLPVFTVGVGRDRLDRDIQVSRVAAPATALRGSVLVVDVTLDQTGYDRETVPLDVERDGRIVASQPVRLAAGGGVTTARVRFTVTDPGPHVFRFRVPPRPGELVTENNARDVLIDVRDRREKILYFEGEPRWEVKFLRRAVADDRNLQLVVLQRTAENKYLRLDVDHPDELASGFPKSREALFAYRGLILGSIEAAAFTGDQLRMIAEFVDRRGGGLLMLGGPRAFAEGGYGGTAVAEVLPVVVDRPGQAEPSSLLRLTVRPTRAGLAHPVVQLAATEESSQARWRDLPQVTSVNPLRQVKPGATVLLSGVDDRGRDQVVLAYQRYGRGKALAFTVQDSWLWQLHTRMAVDDMTHETLWRQLLRWLVDEVPEPVTIRTDPARVEPGEPLTVTAHVRDARYLEVNDARVVAQVTAPSGRTTELVLQWTGEEDGEYRSEFRPDEPGVYAIRVTAQRGAAEPLGTSERVVRVTAGEEEYFDPAMRRALLERIARETGGRFYTPATVNALAEDVRYTGRGVTTVEERELWDMPAVLVLLVGLVLADWSYRRWCRLA